MKLLQEIKQHSFPINKIAPTTECRVFEDDSGALEMAINHKYRPRTKYMNIKLHYFRDYATRKEISSRT